MAKVNIDIVWSYPITNCQYQKTNDEPKWFGQFAHQSNGSYEFIKSIEPKGEKNTDGAYEKKLR